MSARFTRYSISAMISMKVTEIKAVFKFIAVLQL